MTFTKFESAYGCQINLRSRNTLTRVFWLMVHVYELILHILAVVFESGKCDVWFFEAPFGEKKLINLYRTLLKRMRPTVKCKFQSRNIRYTGSYWYQRLTVSSGYQVDFNSSNKPLLSANYKVYSCRNKNRYNCKWVL